MVDLTIGEVVDDLKKLPTTELYALSNRLAESVEALDVHGAYAISWRLASLIPLVTREIRRRQVEG